MSKKVNGDIKTDTAANSSVIDIFNSSVNGESKTDTAANSSVIDIFNSSVNGESKTDSAANSSVIDIFNSSVNGESKTDSAANSSVIDTAVNIEKNGNPDKSANDGKIDIKPNSHSADSYLTPQAESGAVVLGGTNLIKSIGKHVILKDVSINIKSGVVTGLLGANGAGKSTLLKCLTGLWRLDSGVVQYKGEVSSPKVYAKNITYIPERFTFIRGLNAIDNIRYILALVGANIGTKLIIQTLDNLNLNYKDKPERFSMGMRQRLLLSVAILRDTEILLLDEPTNGIDALGIKFTRDFLRDAAKRGKAIVVSSHILAEMENLCDEFYVMRAGHIKPLALSDDDEVYARFEFDSEHIQKAINLFMLEGYSFSDKINPLTIIESNLVIKASRQRLDYLCTKLASADTPLKGLTVKSASLEDAFLRANHEMSGGK